MGLNAPRHRSKQPTARLRVAPNPGTADPAVCLAPAFAIQPLPAHSSLTACASDSLQLLHRSPACCSPLIASTAAALPQRTLALNWPCPQPQTRHG
jgi:hypothetical protein